MPPAPRRAPAAFHFSWRGQEAPPEIYCNEVAVAAAALSFVFPLTLLVRYESRLPPAAVLRPVTFPVTTVGPSRTVAPFEITPLEPLLLTRLPAIIRMFPDARLAVADAPSLVLPETEVPSIVVLMDPDVPLASANTPAVLASMRVFVMTTEAAPDPCGLIWIPPVVVELPLLAINESLTKTRTGMLVGATVMPEPPPLKFRICECRTCTAAAETIEIPDTPVPKPSISSPFSTTTSVAAALIVNPFVPPAATPAVPISQEIVIDFVMFRTPNPPASIQLISPPGAVLAKLPANVLHGAVRLHGLTSSPTPDTQVL